MGPLTKLIGVAIDARVAARDPDPGARAVAARWIAGNALAIRGTRTPTPCGAVSSLDDLLAALAAAPALVDPSTLPVRWRIALRTLGVPMLSGAADAAGAPVLRVERGRAHVTPHHPASRRILAA